MRPGARSQARIRRQRPIATRMLESAEVGHRITKEAYRREEPSLREALLNAQYDLFAKQRGPVLVILSGVGGGGRTETARTLTDWMDPRHLRVAAFGDPAPEERVRPLPWRYWRALPPTGRIAIFMGAWHAEILDARIAGRSSAKDMELALQDVRHFERMLARRGRRAAQVLDPPVEGSGEGAAGGARSRSANRVAGAAGGLPHLPELPQGAPIRARCCCARPPPPRRRGASSRGPTALSRHDRRQGPARDAAAHPCGQGGIEALHARPPPRQRPPWSTTCALLRALDLSKKGLRESDYERRARALARRPRHRLTRHKRFAKRCAGRRVRGRRCRRQGRRDAARDRCARSRAVTSSCPIAAPTDEERAHPYLWRFWRHVPPRGRHHHLRPRWYGRVLVERVERLLQRPATGCAPTTRSTSSRSSCTTAARRWSSSGCRSARTSSCAASGRASRRRTSASRSPPRTGATASSGRRTRRAVADMVDRTSTELAPWTLVEAEDKHFARVKVLETLVTRLEEALKS